MYTKEVEDHLANPRNAGELIEASVTGDVVNQVCNDRIRLTLHIVDGVITDAKFKASGCPPTVAAASVLTTLIIGQEIERAARLSRNDVIAALVRLPPAKIHSAVLAIEALQGALDCINNREEVSGAKK